MFTTSNTCYVRLEIFIQFVAGKAKIWWNNKGSSFFHETRCTEIHKIHTYIKMSLSTVKWAQWNKTQSRELLGLFIVCALQCAQLLHTILHRTGLIIFPLTLQTITIAPMMSIWGKGVQKQSPQSMSHRAFQKHLAAPDNSSIIKISDCLLLLYTLHFMSAFQPRSAIPAVVFLLWPWTLTYDLI